MSDNKERIIEEFIKALKTYRKVKNKNYCCRHGDEVTETPQYQKIVKLYKACPEKWEKELLLLIYKTLLAGRFSDTVFQVVMTNTANSLVDNLELSKEGG